MSKHRCISAQGAVQAEVADRLDHSRKNKAECEDERCAVVRAAKANQGVRRVAEAEQRAADFEIEIGLGRAREI